MTTTRLERNIVTTALLGFLIGCLWLITIRFALVEPPDQVHYHANFSLWVNGEQDAFDNFTFYEEVQACSQEEKDNPRSRAHMHENVAHVIHIHEHGATWGHFFANLGYTLGNDVLKTDEGVFVSGQGGGALKFILNGEPATNIANRLISSRDTLLVSYGNENQQELSTRYRLIKQDAEVYNNASDPASCAGKEAFSLKERFVKALSIHK